MTSSGPRSYSRFVGAEGNMSLTIEKILVPAKQRRTQQGTGETERRLGIFVVFTSVESTLVALKEAGTLAASLGARITLLVPQVVPHPLPLEHPNVLIDFNEKRFRVLAGRGPVETQVQIYLCRDRVHTLSSILGPGAIVVLGGRTRRLWPTRDQLLARELRRAGLEVIFKETE